MSNGWFRKGDNFTLTFVSDTTKKIIAIYRILGFSYPLKKE
jgi:hypothetical protein